MNDTTTPLLVLTDSDRRDPLLKNALTQDADASPRHSR